MLAFLWQSVAPVSARVAPEIFWGSSLAFETFVAADRSGPFRGDLHDQPVDGALCLGPESARSPGCGPAQLPVVRGNAHRCRGTAGDHAWRCGPAGYGVSRQRGG